LRHPSAMDAQTPIENHLGDVVVVDLYGLLSGFDKDPPRRVLEYQRGGRFNLFSIVRIESNPNAVEGYTLCRSLLREERHCAQKSKNHHDRFGYAFHRHLEQFPSASKFYYGVAERSLLKISHAQEPMEK